MGFFALGIASRVRALMSERPGSILPTYNEAENIEPFIRAVLPRLAEGAADHKLLVVDDSSPDGTGEIADRLAAEHDAVEVLHRSSKEGLGRAYLAGFSYALERGAELVLEMDADFSHDPADIPRLIAAAADADIVLGSRYVEGGGVTDWGLVRRIVSRGGLLVRARRARRSRARPDRRLQVLPARGAGTARPRRRCTPTATAFRSS